MAGGKRAQVRFFDHDTNRWFDAGDEVPAEVANRLGDHLFEVPEDDAETQSPKTAQRRGK